MTQPSLRHVQLSDPAAPGSPLHRWLCAVGAAPERLEPLAGDVSARRYLRIHHHRGSAVLALYPRSMTAVCARFSATSELLDKAGIRVPAVRASECDRGWMLLEDLGDETLYSRRDGSWRELGRWLEQAVDLAARIAELDPAAVAALNPPLDGELLEKELRQTWDVFLQPQRLIGGRRDASRLAAAFSELCQRLDEQPRSPCHRDFMARNLAPLGDGRLAVLDHQDLRLGPPQYDLASLLNDSLFPPAEVESALLAGRLTADAERGYHRAAAQRTLKAVGTFAAFAARGNERHLGLVAPTLRRGLDHLQLLPETAEAIAPVAGRWREYFERAVC